MFDGFIKKFDVKNFNLSFDAYKNESVLKILSNSMALIEIEVCLLSESNDILQIENGF